MNCHRFRNHIDRLFDEGTSPARSRRMHRHLAQCPACALLYRQTQAALDAAAPRCEVRASASLKERILEAAAAHAPAEQAPQHRRASVPGAAGRTSRPRYWSLGALAACALVAVLLLVPNYRSEARAARTLFRHAAASFAPQTPYYLELDVRTLPDENFRYIDAAQPFVLHRMWVVPGIPDKWRLEKGGRAACSDGRQIRMWNPDARTGWIHSPGAAAIEDFSLLRDPRTLLLHEEALAAGNSGATYRKEATEDEIRLTVEMPAAGDFTEDYLLNSSVPESNTLREYRFDRATGRLLGFRISQRLDGNTVPVIRLRRIDYGAEIAESLLTHIPDGIEWIDLTRPVNGTAFAGIAPEEAARKLFGAFRDWNEPLLREVLAYYALGNLKAFAGCRLIETGAAFRSGQYPGVFVPCRVVLADGSTRQITLALRNDNPAGAWVADGGI